MSGLILPVTLDGERITISQNYGDDFAWKGYSQYYRQYYGLDGHNGIDFGGWGIDGEPVFAAGDGTVVYAGRGDYWDSTVGGGSFTVVIYHPHLGVWTAYLHLRNNSNTLKAGQKVKQGQMIARAGNTGIGTGAHLHFQVMPVAPLPLVYQPNWGCVNPRPYMQRITAQAATAITPTFAKDEDMGYKDWSAEDKRLLKQDIAWAVQGYKRKGEKQDASHMLRYIYDAIKRVEKGVKLFTPKAFWRHPLVSRAASSKGKTYGADTFLEVVNARSEETQRNEAELLAQNEAMLTAIQELAKSKSIDAEPIVAAINAAADRATERVGDAIQDSVGDIELTFTTKTSKEEDEAADAEIAAAVASIANVEEK